MPVIQTESNFGILPAGFQHEIDTGYRVLVGKNNVGKSSFLQLAFRQLYLLGGEYDRTSVCLILPQRFSIIAGRPGTQLGPYNDWLFGQMGSGPIPSQSDALFDQQNQLMGVLISQAGATRQNNSLNELLKGFGFPEEIEEYESTMQYGNLSVSLQGSGLRRILPILSALINPNIKAIFIDEPELSLEPTLQKKLRSLFIEKGREKIIVVATHSHLFLNPEEISNNFIFDTAEPIIRQVSNTSEMISVTWDLLGNELSDLFLPDNFLVVEGSSDEAIVNKVLSLKYPSKKVKVISAQGYTNIPNRVEAICSVLVPIATNDSPYRRRIVVLVDNIVNNTEQRLAATKRMLGTRFIELSSPSLEDYLPSELYQKAELDKVRKLSDIEEASSRENKDQIKKEISSKIAQKLEIEDLNLIPEIVGAVEKAVTI